MQLFGHPQVVHIFGEYGHKFTIFVIFQQLLQLPESLPLRQEFAQVLIIVDQMLNFAIDFGSNGSLLSMLGSYELVNALHSFVRRVIILVVERTCHTRFDVRLLAEVASPILALVFFLLAFVHCYMNARLNLY